MCEILGYHACASEDYGLVEYEAVYFIFSKNTVATLLPNVGIAVPKVHRILSQERLII